jgi:uncharacterized membrane protein (UPF0182 family)
MRRGVLRLLAAAVALLVLGLLFGGGLLSLYVDFLWFQALGYAGPYLTIFQARVVLFALGAALLLAVFLPNVLGARRAARRIAAGPVRLVVAAGTSWDDRGPRPFGDLADFVGGPGAAREVALRLGARPLIWSGIALAVLFGLVAAGQWETVLRALHGTPFGERDPVFGHDVGFYVFVLPLLHAVTGWLLWAVTITLLACLGLYGLALYATVPGPGAIWRFLFDRARPARSHLLLLAAVLLALVAAGTWLDGFGFLVARHGRVVGANYTDLHARLPATYALAASVSLVAVLTAMTVWRRSLTLPLGGLMLVLVMLLLGRGALPALVQRLQVDPAEVIQERPYIAANIAATRRAFGVDTITEQIFPANESVSLDEIRDNTATLANIRLWDYRPLRDSYNQLQSIRPYYVFGDVDIDRYTLDGAPRQVMLAARELAPDRLGVQAQTWINRRLQFTHGYGLVMSPVNQVTQEGQPIFLIKDVPPTGPLPIERPEVYFGENSSGYVVVNTTAREFDYPSGDQNVFVDYAGSGGVALGPIWQRAALALSFGDFNLLISSYLHADSRLLFRRQIAERVQRLAPYLKLDRDPYLVVADGKLSWVVDAYTTSDGYPYSQVLQESVPLNGAAPADGGPPISRRVTYNYIRNSVKVVVGAYDGAVSFYVADPADPLIRTYATIFPQQYRPLETLPPALRPHLRYPEDLFRSQSQILRTYHVQDVQVFYNGEDVWNTPFEAVTPQRAPIGSSADGTPNTPAAAGAAQRAPVEPYYVTMRLPGETREEFLLMVPFTPASRDNMIAWLAARCDGPDYGKLVLYKFPKDRLIYGPAQIDARIDQEPTISAQLTLWNQHGSSVLRGNLLVIPVGGSTLYVEPIYLQAVAGRLPELRRVVLATGNRLVMEPTLEAGLARLYGVEIAPAGAAPAAPAAPAPEVLAAASTARATYQRAMDALRGGDFGSFGDELRRLDDELRRLEGAAGERPAGASP